MKIATNFFLRRRSVILSLILGAVVITGLVFSFSPIFSQIAKAMPDTFCTSTIATSSPVYLTPGGTVATTTIYASAGCASPMYGTKMYSMLGTFIASSSVSLFQIRQEFAQGPDGVDCISNPTACDWYSGSLTTVSGYSTTTSSLANLDIAPVPVFLYDFASSTVGGVGSGTGQLGPTGTNNRDSKLLMFAAPTRYSRWIVNMATVTNGNGAFAAQIVGKKEIGEG